MYLTEIRSGLDSIGSGEVLVVALVSMAMDLWWEISWPTEQLSPSEERLCFM
jgi:hypothetical protein